MKQKLWGPPTTAKLEVVDLVDEIPRLIRDATALGHDDGERNWPCPATQGPTQAETAVRARAQRLMFRASQCFDAELTRACRSVASASARYLREQHGLPEVLRRAKAVLDARAAQVERLLLDAARLAEDAQRHKRSEEVRAGARLDTEGSGSRPLMLAVLAAAVCAEAALTATLIADAHPQGLMGASVLAATVAGLQLAYAFSVGRLVRAMFDRGHAIWRTSAAGVAIAGTLGLAIGHAVIGRMRELTLAVDYEVAMRQAVPDVLVGHQLPTEASAVLLSLVGMACGVTGLVMGMRRLDAKRAEDKCKLAEMAEQALENFANVRAEVEDSADTVQASALLDALDADVAKAHGELGEAVHEWQMRLASREAMQRELLATYRIAIDSYRAGAARLRSDSAPECWNAAGAIVPLELPRPELDRAPVAAAHTLLVDDGFRQASHAARVELERVAKAHAGRRSQRIAQLEEAVYRDWFRPVGEGGGCTPAAQLVPVSELRRAVPQ